MFSRYRRTPPSSANGTPNKRRGSKANKQDPAAALAELRSALNRLDELTESFRGIGNALLTDLEAGIEKKENAAVAGADANTPVEVDATAVENDIADDKQSVSKEAAHKPTTFRRSPSATVSDLLLATNAHFISIPEKEEEEMVELIRRVAELVVLSERMAGQILEGSSSRRSSNVSSNTGDADDDKSNNSEDAMSYLALFELFCERNALANIVNIVTGVAFAPREKQQSSSRPNSSNSLDKIQSTTITDQTPHILPPLTIATQAIQSVSILIQNVSRATSLYFLLSNNRVNDLIGLPIHLYKRAEMNHTHYLRFARRGSRRPTTYTGLPLPVPPTSQSLSIYTSNEIGELTTHFVSFLKSLAMRVNPETLQFFLTYTIVHISDDEHVRSSAITPSSSADVDGTGQPCDELGAPPIDTQHSTDDELDTMSEHLISKIMDSKPEVQNATVAAEETKETPVVSAPHSNGDASMQSTDSEPSAHLSANESSATGAQQPEQQPVVEFPLYARALEFCSSEMDSFVRVTAMNICMNMIRLATVQHDHVAVDTMSLDENIDDDDKMGADDEDIGDHQTSLPTITPSGMLHEAPSLHMGDRIAIAKYACDPRRVSDLVSPLCARLTTQFGQVEGTVRNLQELANASIPKHLQHSKAERKSRLANTVHDLVANVQDELLMLDDLLRVGLVSLNEQAIEMLLATFVYPMLLQPLLLPLHRFSPSPVEGGQQQEGNSVASSNQNSSSDQMPKIKLQSPPPLCIDSANRLVPSEEEPSSNSTPFPPSQNELSKTYSSEDIDVAPSKTALFGITIIFHSVSNPCLKHLLLASLLHPFSPPASGGSVVQIPPQITFSGDHSDIIRMENNHRLESASALSVAVYNFGTCVQYDSSGGDENGNANLCTFILAPALIDLLSQSHEGNDDDADESSKRFNPYRKILLSYLLGSGEMVSLQKLAIMALHDIASKVDAQIIREVALSLSSSRPKSESANSEGQIQDMLKETLDCLCQSIVNKSVTLDGWWKVSFNPAAAKTLLDVISTDAPCLSYVYNAITRMRVEAANFLLSLPSRLDEKSRKSSNKGDGKTNSVDKQHLETWLLDRFYFDQPTKSSSSVVEYVCKLDTGRCGMEVLGSQSVNDASELLCEDSRIVENMLVSETKGNTPFHCAASWALACLLLDAYCMKLFEMKARTEVQPSHDDAASQLSSATSDDTDADLLSCLSPKLAIALLDQTDSDGSPKKKSAAPEHGSIVGLVGKAAFPCVCEVSSECSSLFTGRTCVSNDGVQWQSLYLVVIGKFAVLAEPERGGVGGEGRVITSCKLSCLAVKKDTTVMANNNTPARRLLLQHSSLDQDPPPLFVLDSSSDKKPSYGPDRLSLARSRVDLWFEDSNACSVAWKALAGKIAKARAKRGARIRSALLEPDSCMPPGQTETKASI